MHIIVAFIVTVFICIGLIIAAFTLLIDNDN